MIEKIKTTDAPAAIGPYSQATRVGSFVFTSGQIALDPETGALCEGGIEAQTERVMKNLNAVLLASNSSAELIVKTTCFLADMSDFAKFNEIYAKYIPCAPARSCVAVAALPKGALVEVEAVALARAKED